jgi:hypothetical protein
MLLRSPRNQTSLTNLDIIFAGVRYLEMPTIWSNLSIGEGTEEEMNAIRLLLKRDMLHEKVFILYSGETRFKVVAVGMKIFENELDLFESSLESFNA